MKNFGLFLALLFINLNDGANLLGLSSAIAVPCYHKHFCYLPSLLESLTEQTRLPDEVLISLSQVEELDHEEIERLEKGPWPFKVEIIKRKGVHMEGSNRTKAVLSSGADVVLCIDADDIPHPQRVEAVMQLFESDEEIQLVLCGHAYCPNQAIVCESSIPFFSPEEFKKMRFELGVDHWHPLESCDALVCWKSGVHNGSPSVRRSLFRRFPKLRWSNLKNGADLEFNRKVLLLGQKGYLLALPLLHYFNARSSGADVGR